MGPRLIITDYLGGGREVGRRREERRERDDVCKVCTCVCVLRKGVYLQRVWLLCVLMSGWSVCMYIRVCVEKY